MRADSASRSMLCNILTFVLLAILAYEVRLQILSSMCEDRAYRHTYRLYMLVGFENNPSGR